MSSSSAMELPDFRALFEFGPGLRLVVTPDCIVVAASNDFLRATRRTRDAVVGRSVFDVLPEGHERAEGDADSLREAFERAFRDKRTERTPFEVLVRKVELRRPERDGQRERASVQVRYWSGVLLPIPTIDGTIGHVIYRIEDVTTLVAIGQSDRQPSKIDETSDAKARARAEEALSLKEEQLRHAQKMDAVGRLATGVAHDFNNMMSVVLSYGSLIRNDLPADSVSRADVEEIIGAGRRAAELARQLLTFSRQEPRQPQVLDLNQVLVGMDRILQCVVGQGISLVHLAAPTPACTSVDASHIEQVIMNLVLNARDAMPDGGTITIETADVTLDEWSNLTHLPADAGPYVLLSVTDTGCGMDEETQARIFEPFFTTKPEGAGTGLGLSTLFGIVQQSRGSVSVRSEPGKGSTFSVFLPRVLDGASAEDAKTRGDGDSAAERTSPGVPTSQARERFGSSNV